MKAFVVTETTSLIPIGKQGENNAVSVLFKVSAWQNEYGGGGIFTLSHKRATDETSYPVLTTFTNDGVLWKVSDADNAVVGYGECELRYSVNDVIKKSITWKTKTAEALSPTGDTPPEPYESWYENIISAGDRAEGFEIEAEGYANSARLYSDAAAGYASAAEIAKGLSEQYSAEALAHRNAAETAETAAETAEAAAQAAAESAEADKLAAAASAQAARASELASKSSENAAAASEAAAKASETAAQSASSAAYVSAQNAQSYAQSAFESAQNAANSAIAAASSASQAQSHAQSAALSAQNAAASATAAATSETNASTSATAASQSAAAASASATNAAESELAARGYAEDAQAAAVDIQDSIDGVAQEDTALATLDVLTDISAMLNGMNLFRYVDELPETGLEGATYATPDGFFHYENGEYIQISGSGDLNGFSLSRNADGSVTLGYTNPDDETDTDSVILPTNNTAEDVLSVLESIVESLTIIAGQN